MENAPAFHPLDYISVLRRQMWWLIIPAVLAIVVGTVAVMYWPRTYESRATLGISLPTMNGQVVSDSQRLTPQERVRSFNQLLLSPPVLERVAREEGLDKSMPLADAVALVGANARMSMPGPDPNGQINVEVFFLDVDAKGAALSARLANRLAEVFVDESSKKRAVRAEDTSTFIAETLKDSQTRLAELEGKLRTSKEGYMGSLPEQTQSNVALVTSSQQQLLASSNALRGEQDRLQWIESQLSTSKPTIAEPGAKSDSPTPSASPATTRVLTLQKQLDEAKLIYTPRHPAVQDLETELAAAKKAAEAEVAVPEKEREAQLRLDPVYAQLTTQRKETQLRIADLQRQQQTYNEQIARYTNRVDTAPRVEQALASLQRDTDLERQRYQQLTQRYNDARIAERVEANRGSEHFTIIAHAGVPDAPITPNVPRTMIMVVLFALCLGGGLALGREYLDRSIHDARALSDLELPVLGEIPRISHV